MSHGTSVALAGRRSVTFAAAANLADVDAFKSAAATPTSAVTYSAADLDGVLANPGPSTDAKMLVPRYPSVTSTANAATYNTTDAIQFHGTYGGESVTRSATLTDANGDETIIADGPLDTLTSIDVPAQLLAGGTLAFGFSGIGRRRRNGVDQRLVFYPAADGTVKVGYPDGITDSMPVQAYLVAPASPYRIYADTTDVGITVLE